MWHLATLTTSAARARWSRPGLALRTWIQHCAAPSSSSVGDGDGGRPCATVFFQSPTTHSSSLRTIAAVPRRGQGRWMWRAARYSTVCQVVGSNACAAYNGTLHSDQKRGRNPPCVLRQTTACTRRATPQQPVAASSSMRAHPPIFPSRAQPAHRPVKPKAKAHSHTPLIPHQHALTPPPRALHPRAHAAHPTRALPS